MPAPTFDDVLNCPNLPTLPNVAAQILELTSDPDVSIDEIEKLVQGDQGLSTRVVRTVNSSLFGLRQPCTSIKRALAYLGLNAVKSLVLGFSLVDLSRFINELEDFDFQDYWRRVLYGAAGARHFAVHTGACDPDEAFTAGIFQDMGMLANLTVFPQEYVEILRAVGENHETLDKTEDEVLGFNHARVGAELGQKWRMPQALTETIRYHHDPDKAPGEIREIARVVCLGRMAANILSWDQGSQELASLLIKTNEWYGQQESDIEAFLNGIAVAGKDLAAVLSQSVGPMPDIQEIMNQAQEQQVAHHMAVQREMDELKETNETLHTAASTDGLTGLFNRKSFDDALDANFHECRRENTPVSALFMDADRFKSVNDIFGHQAGDAVLIELAQRLQSACEETGTPYRYGGEEFAVLLPGVTAEDAAVFAENLRKAVELPHFNLEGIEGAPPTLDITISIGVASTNPGSPDGHTDPARLLREADEAVYASKEGGRNSVTIFGQQPLRTGQKPTPMPPRDENGVTPQVAAAPAPAPAAAPVAAPAPEATAASAMEAASSEFEANLGGFDLGDAPTGNTDNGRLRVLLIDDDALVRALLTVVFQKMPNISVDIATDGRQAIAALKEAEANEHARPDMIIFDLNLPDCSSLQIIRAMKKSSSLCSIPVVTITASSSDQALEECKEAGAVDAFRKHEISANLGAWASNIINQWTGKKAA